jgi:hypothetical protein
MNYKIIIKKKTKSQNSVRKLPEYQRFSQPLEASKSGTTLERKEGEKRTLSFEAERGC